MIAGKIRIVYKTGKNFVLRLVSASGLFCILIFIYSTTADKKII
jgi:hypothetical protein